MTNTASSNRLPCPIANSLDLLGDKWTLLVIRDLLNGKRRYKQFQDSIEKIPTNILASRLKKLEAADMVRKVEYQKNPPRYEYKPSRKTVELLPVVLELARWGGKHMEGAYKIPDEIIDEQLQALK